MSKLLVDRDRMVESMCLTWRHDFGLDKLEGCDFCSGMTDKEREHLRGQMGKLFDHHFAPALPVVTAERDALREDRDSQQRVCIAEMEKVSQLRAEVEALRLDATLGSAIQRACRDLPEGFIVSVSLEKDAGTLELCLPDTDAALDDFDGETFADQIHAAIDAAKAAKGA